MIVCLFYRRVIARCIDANRALPEKAQNHLRNCPSCRQSYELQREVTLRLMAGAARRYQSHAPFLHAKIMATLRRGANTAESAPGFLRPIWAAALVIVALGLFSAALIRHSLESDNQVAVTRPTGPSPTLPTPLPIFNTNATQLASRNLSEWSRALDEPLETEMQSVVIDAKAALQLLAQNFLPDTGLGGAPR